ncbi:hypothetical protein [Nostoc sp.]|uniref:hypothetical protein n=1 Tax=Nostoc sp. TaxID=1180 RepID=UPI002FF97514
MIELNNVLKEQLALRVEKGITNQIDEIIRKMVEISKRFAIAGKDEKSPFRNVLGVSVDSSSSIEVIKNYIRYQIGRRGSSPIWTTSKDKEIFAVALVKELDDLKQDAESIVKNVQKGIAKGHDLESYIEESNNRHQLTKQIHMKLVQLYLGYLAREHTASIGELNLKT